MNASKSHNLSDIQRWVMDVITHPSGARTGIEASATGGTSGLKGEKAHTVIRRSKNLTSLERIEIYSTMYYLRLVEILEGDFQAVRHAVGEERFTELARDYITEHPSRYYDLSAL